MYIDIITQITGFFEKNKIIVAQWKKIE